VTGAYPGPSSPKLGHLGVRRQRSEPLVCCHRDGAAKLYRIAVEKATLGSIFHAVAGEGIPLKHIAVEVRKQLRIPMIGISPEKVSEHFDWFHFGAMGENLVLSAKTRERLGWNPTNPH
jgi:nucleoside-diphosphate-sugar epimerase